MCVRVCLRACVRECVRACVCVHSQVLIYTGESTRASMERTKMPNLRKGSKGGFEPGSLDCESGILPLSYTL